ncbi:MAG: hypothetical protein HC906_09355 [Bacteroidales bacterium]|nr:hypothetical protein [Bacteroidales bacterium]
MRLVGVSVVAKGTNTGTISDLDGYFTLQVHDTTRVLQFGYIGYKPKEVYISSDKNLNIAMAAEENKLEEVVVTGYAKRMKDETGSISTIRFDEDENLVPDEQTTQLISKADSLKKILKTNENDLNARKALAEVYLELKYRNRAVDELTFIMNRLTSEEKTSEIGTIIDLTKNKDFETALSRLRYFETE